MTVHFGDVASDQHLDALSPQHPHGLRVASLQRMPYFDRAVAQAHGLCLSLEKRDRMGKKDRQWGSQCNQFHDLNSGLMSLVERQRTVLASRPQRRRELHAVTGMSTV